MIQVFDQPDMIDDLTDEPAVLVCYYPLRQRYLTYCERLFFI